jgi:ubiquinone/menaquinone biosynthesis C-methylase UbiE
MKLNFFERLITNSPLRGLLQRYVEVPRLKAMASRDSYPHCLEIGCGTGRGAELIVRFFNARQVVATDVDPEQLRRARRRIGKKPLLRDKIIFKVEDALALKEPSESFDAVFAFGVVHHTEDWRKCLKEVYRVLKPGGEFFFEELLGDFINKPHMRLLSAHPEGGMFSAEEFLAELQGLGMKLRGLRRIRNVAIAGVARKESP